MIYTVECSYTDPASEAEWNDFYSRHKLPALISVSGFRSSQRFKALHAGCPAYLALHTIDNLEVLLSDEYRHQGGGNFARWQPHIADWHRNLYDGAAPAIAADAYLLVSATGPEPLTRLGLAAQALHAVALEQSPPRRWLAVLQRPPASALQDIDVYAPLGAPLSSAA